MQLLLNSSLDEEANELPQSAWKGEKPNSLPGQEIGDAEAGFAQEACSDA